MTISDADRAQISFTAAVDEVAEGGEISLVFEISNGVTFAEPQTLRLALSGTATPGDDFTLTTSNRQDLTSSTSLILPAHAGSVRLALVAATDQEEDPDETVEISISHESNSIGTVTVTIADTVPTLIPRRPNVRGATGGGGGGGAGREPSTAVMIVANGWRPSDIGAAAALAARTPHSAVIYTTGDRLSVTTRGLLSDYQPESVIVVGGEAAISDTTLTSALLASASDSVERIAGASRADTAARVARRILGTPPVGGSTLIVANGWSPADIGVAAALSVRTPRSAGRVHPSRQAARGDRPAASRVQAGESGDCGGNGRGVSRGGHSNPCRGT